MPGLSIDKLVTELNRINARRDELIRQINSAISEATRGAASIGRGAAKKRKISPEGKRKIAAAARKRWAKYRAEKAVK